MNLTFVVNPAGVDVVLEVDKRGGLFGGGHDVYPSVHVPHLGADQADRAMAIDGWRRQVVLTDALTRGHPPAYGCGYGSEHG